MNIIPPTDSTLGAPQPLIINDVTPGALATITATMRDAKGTPWISTTDMRADDRGEINTATTLPVHAEWARPTSLGIFWTMRPEGHETSPFIVGESVPLDIRVRCEGKGLGYHAVLRPPSRSQSSEAAGSALGEKGVEVVVVINGDEEDLLPALPEGKLHDALSSAIEALGYRCHIVDISSAVSAGHKDSHERWRGEAQGAGRGDAQGAGRGDAPESGHGGNPETGQATHRGALETHDIQDPAEVLRSLEAELRDWNHAPIVIAHGIGTELAFLLAEKSLVRGVVAYSPRTLRTLDWNGDGNLYRPEVKKSGFLLKNREEVWDCGSAEARRSAFDFSAMQCPLLVSGGGRDHHQATAQFLSLLSSEESEGGYGTVGNATGERGVGNASGESAAGNARVERTAGNAWGESAVGNARVESAAGNAKRKECTRGAITTHFVETAGYVPGFPYTQPGMPFTHTAHTGGTAGTNGLMSEDLHTMTIDFLHKELGSVAS